MKELLEKAEEKGYNIEFDLYTEEPDEICMELALLQKWLRDIHNVHIEIPSVGDNTYYVFIPNSKNGYIYENTQKINNPTLFYEYEEALKVGISTAIDAI